MVGEAFYETASDPGTTAKIPVIEQETRAGVESTAAADPFSPKPQEAFTQAEVTGGTKDHYEELEAVLLKFGEDERAKLLTDTLAAIISSEKNSRRFEQEHLAAETRLIAQLKKEAREGVDNKIAEIKQAGTSLRSSVANALRNAKQAFFDICKRACLVLRQDKSRVHGMMLSFSHVEDILRSAQKDYRNHIVKLEKRCEDIERHSVQRHTAKAHFLNAIASMRGQETAPVESVEAGQLARELANTSRDWIDVLEDAVAGVENLCLDLEDRFANSEVANIGHAFGTEIYATQLKGSDEYRIMIEGKDVQSAYNSLEANPQAMYRAFQAQIDPTGEKLEKIMQSAGRHSADLDREACAGVVAEACCFYDTKASYLHEELPVPSSGQSELAAVAAESYKPLKLHRPCEDRGGSLLDAAYKKAADIQERRELAGDDRNAQQLARVGEAR